MKYMISMNGSRYEVEVQRISPFRMLTREETAAGLSAPAAPVAPPARRNPPAEPSPKPAPPAPAPAPPPARTNPEPAGIPAGGCAVTAPLPGTILDIRTSPGQVIKAGQVVVAMEAMKMEHEIIAPADGTVARILINKGDVVETGAVLIQLL